MTPRSVRITGWGSYAPERVLTNADLEQLVDTSDEWIRSRTGIRERRVAAPHETTATLGAIAGKRAIATAGLQPDDIDLIIVATLTPDYWMPSTAALVKEAIGNRTAAAFDVAAACSGFVYAYATADSFLRSGLWKPETWPEADSIPTMHAINCELKDLPPPDESLGKRQEEYRSRLF